MRVLAETARSRFTFDPVVSEPRFVRRRVSGATPTVKEDVVKEVTVKQVPFMDIESPRWQSVRTSVALDMVRFVPPSAARGLSSETSEGVLDSGLE